MEDGQLGSKPESKLKVQAEARLPQDGYPDYQLCRKLINIIRKSGLVP